MKLIKIDDRTYINPEKITAIDLPPYPMSGQYLMTISLEDEVKVELQFDTLEEGKRLIKELMSDER